VEVLQILARTVAFESIHTKEAHGYQLLDSDLNRALGQLRGMKVSQENLLEAECRLTITTVQE
jgi:hypothetical protein